MSGNTFTPPLTPQKPWDFFHDPEWGLDALEQKHRNKIEEEEDMNTWQKIWADPKTTIPGIIAGVLSLLVALGVISPAQSGHLQTPLIAVLGGIVALLGIFSNWPHENSFNPEHFPLNMIVNDKEGNKWILRYARGQRLYSWDKFKPLMKEAFAMWTGTTIYGQSVTINFPVKIMVMEPPKTVFGKFGQAVVEVKVDTGSGEPSWLVLTPADAAALLTASAS